MDKLQARRASWLIFEDWTISDPECPGLREALHTARYGNPTRQQANLILAAATSYVHLATHPAGTESMIKQLKAIRKALTTATTTREGDING